MNCIALSFISVCFSTPGIEAPDLTSLLEQFEETQGEKQDFLGHCNIEH